MKSSLFPDVNVWLALTHNRHVHHPIAAEWFQGTDDPVFFCRFTQLGFLRLLTSEQVMGVDVMSQRRAWATYHRWYEDARVDFHREPESAAMETWLEELSTRPRPSPKVWADAYLAAFAKTAGLKLVTFDEAFGRIPALQAEILSAV